MDESTIADELAAAAEKYDPCGVTIGCYPYYEESGRDRGVRTCPSACLSRADESRPTRPLRDYFANITPFRPALFCITSPTGIFGARQHNHKGSTNASFLFSPALISSSSPLLLFSISQARTIVLVEGKSKSDVAECVEEILGKTPSAAVIFAEEGEQLGEPSHRRLSVP